jgi:hypothetical protein
MCNCAVWKIFHLPVFEGCSIPVVAYKLYKCLHSVDITGTLGQDFRPVFVEVKKMSQTNLRLGAGL